MSNCIKVIVVNGSGGVGKDTFIDLCQESCKTAEINKISTVDYVKQIAKICGWSGTKTPKDRKFLSDLKDALEEWDDIPNKEIGVGIERLSTYNTPQILFVHAREPHNIQYYKDKYNAITVLVTNDRVEQVTSNHADLGVYDFTYDWVIENNGSLEELQESAKTFIKKFNIFLDKDYLLCYNRPRKEDLSYESKNIRGSYT